MNTKRVVNEGIIKKLSKKRFNCPIIGHFKDKSIRFNSINEATSVTKIPQQLIFESAVGKISSASVPGKICRSKWEFEDGKDWIKYHAYYVRSFRKYTKLQGFNS